MAVYCLFPVTIDFKCIMKKILLCVIFSLVTGFIVLQKVNAEPEMTVYKSATCGCCKKWVEHMEDNGFRVNAIDVLDMDLIKQRYGVNREAASCHTALIDGYIIEGHVPAFDVKRLLAEKPDVQGLFVPGMPAGSPGMEMGDRVDKYSVISLDKNGNAHVFNQY
jgi:hypothetical protein